MPNTGEDWHPIQVKGVAVPMNIDVDVLQALGQLLGRHAAEMGERLDYNIHVA